MKNKTLPVSWCVDVEKEKDSPFYEKFMNWINKKTKETPSQYFKYYGQFKRVGNFGVWCYDTDKDYGIKMVTLEEWHNFYFPDKMKKEYAFPTTDTVANGERYEPLNTGLIKLEYFAGLAMNGLLSSVNPHDFDSDELTKASVRISKELLNHLQSDI